MQIHQTELYLLYLAGLFYAITAVILIVDRFIGKSNKLPIIFAVSGLLLHSLSIGVRWQRTGHGPFINLYEILSSNVWSLFLAFTLFIIFMPKYRVIAKFVLPVIAMLFIWLLVVDPKDTYLPPTYNTIWLYFHVIAGKVFFSLLLLASGFAVYELLASNQPGKLHYEKNPQTGRVQLAHGFLVIAFVFDSFMLFFGAIWAQDAWGRYWAWDPLETWAFLSWLGIVFTLHLKMNQKSDKVFCWLIIACFVLAFLTFFGVPFFSTAAHKGMI